MKKKNINSLLLSLFALLLLGCSGNTSSCYYLDAMNGDDNKNGHSVDNAWKSLSKLKNVRLKPGDKVLLKRGREFSRGIGNIRTGNT
ncbi:MAG: hypothetical protein ACLVEJ_06535 [Parabacteroides sp.]